MRLLPGFFLAFALSFPVIFPGAAQAQPKTPALQMRVASIDSLMQSFFLLADRVGRQEEAKQLEGMLKGATGPDGIQGLDPKRPMGLYGTIGPNGVDSEAVLAVPSLDDEKMLGALSVLAAALGGKLEKGKAGAVHTLNLDQSPFPIYFRFAKKYCWATLRDEVTISLARLPDPETFFQSRPGSLVSLRFDLNGVPENLRQMAVDQLKEKLNEAREQGPADETAKQKDFRLKVANAMEKGLVDFLKEGGALGAELGLDREADELYMGMELTPKLGGELAQSWNALTDQQTVGGGLAKQGSAMALAINMKIPDSLHQSLAAVLEELRIQALAKEKDPVKKELAQSMFAAISPTLVAGKFDMGMALSPSKGGDRYSMVMGLKVQEGQKVEGLLRKLATAPAKGDENKVTLDIAKVGSVNLHQFEQGAKDDQGAKDLFGTGPGFFAVREDALLIGAGPDGLAQLKQALASKPGPSPLFSCEMGFAQFARVADRNLPREKMEKAAKKAFGKVPDADRLRILMESNNGIKASIRLKTPVLTFFNELDPNRTN